MSDYIGYDRLSNSYKHFCLTLTFDAETTQEEQDMGINEITSQQESSNLQVGVQNQKKGRWKPRKTQSSPSSKRVHTNSRAGLHRDF